METDKYHETDKEITKEIMKEVEGEEIECQCPYCRGSGCDECDETGSIWYEF
jgi:hypothetical protein